MTNLTPELHQHIAEKLVDNVPAEQVIASLTSISISPEDAQILYDRVVMLRNQALNMPVIGQTQQFKPAMGQAAATVPFTMAPAPTMTPVPVPDPIKNFPELLMNQIKLSDKTVDVVTVVELPRLIVIDNFLSDEECQHLIDLGLPSLQRSTTVNSENGSSEVNVNRTSEGAYFSRGQTDTILRIENRLAELAGWPVENGEGMQVMRYAQGQEYKAHYDYFDPNNQGTAGILAGPGQRVATLLMYLNTPEQGGSTDFPHAGISVRAKTGRLVFFSYDTPTSSTKTIHAGAPVLQGEKWIATKWLRERKF